MQRYSNNINNEIIHALSNVNPNNVIPTLEQSIELENLKMIINPEDDTKEKIRDLMFLLNFFRIRRLGG